MKAAGVPVLLAAWAVPRDRSSLVWALMPRPPTWGSDDKDKVLLECIEGIETEIFLSGLQEGSFTFTLVGAITFFFARTDVRCPCTRLLSLNSVLRREESNEK